MKKLKDKAASSIVKLSPSPWFRSDKFKIPTWDEFCFVANEKCARVMGKNGVGISPYINDLRFSSWIRFNQLHLMFFLNRTLSSLKKSSLLGEATKKEIENLEKKNQRIVARLLTGFARKYAEWDEIPAACVPYPAGNDDDIHKILVEMRAATRSGYKPSKDFLTLPLNYQDRNCVIGLFDSLNRNVTWKISKGALLEIGALLVMLAFNIFVMYQ